MTYTLHHGDCLETLRTMPDNSVDSIVTDPPYGLSFMGKKWDYDVPATEVWAECLRVLKPGGHLLAFAGTRTQHRMAVRIEDAGFEIRDMIAWVYGSGFPKSMDVSKAIDKMDAAEARRARQLRFTEWVRSTGLTSAEIDRITDTNMGGHYTTAASQPAVATREHFEKLRPHLGADVPDWVEQMVDERTVESENFKRREVLRTVTGKDTSLQRPGIPLQDSSAKREYSVTAAHTETARQWQGWGTALKPALEPITVARKPLIGTVAANVLQHGTGALNIDGCRVWTDEDLTARSKYADSANTFNASAERRMEIAQPSGRWPANFCHDGSEEVLAGFPDTGKSAGGSRGAGERDGWGMCAQPEIGSLGYGDTGSAARFFKQVSHDEEDLATAQRFMYCAKASKRDRDEGLEGFELRKAETMNSYTAPSEGRTADKNGGPKANFHPTVKPTDLMRYLCRLVTPPGGLVLDPFMGSGSTGKAARLEGFRFVGCELSAEYLEIARARIESAAKPRQPGLSGI